MPYDEEGIIPLQGAFYATTARSETIFNFFREEDTTDQEKFLQPLDGSVEDFVLKDNNLVAIKNQPEFSTNKSPEKATNKIATSLLRKERLAFLLQYAFAYVKSQDGYEKHIMRYPQIFATKAIASKLDEGIKKGIIWHTQGSGKTALAFYNVKYLTNYFRERSVVPKFYFIVDRLDLLKQASKEFDARGLKVHHINSREEFAKDIKSNSAIHNDDGKAEITVVNIQKFENNPYVTRNTDYNINVQRIYFLDEVHRSYNPNGSFLANLNESDEHAIKIGLTGTPLLGSDFNSKKLFGGYIHKYYYNSSIADGYTLRLIREEIETTYQLSLKKILDELTILKGSGNKKQIYAHRKFVEPMLSYIVEDFENARIQHADTSIGGMVVCDSSDQAKMMYEIFQQNYAVAEGEQEYSIAADSQESYGKIKSHDVKAKKAALILHDVGTKSDRNDWVEDFKTGKYDLLFVYNMLLTGFDAPRLKKLYLGRIIKAHNLLQTLTRVNRTYRDFKYGRVVDFAGIEEQFRKTSQDYFNELQNELGDELESYSDLFLTEEQISEKIDQIKERLLYYDLTDKEVFDEQISEITDKDTMREISRALNEARSLFNQIRLSGKYDMLAKLDFRQLAVLATAANSRLASINHREVLEQGSEAANILNLALEEIVFEFTKVKEEEMILADKYRESLKRTREMLQGNFDQQDPEFISLKEELERLFKKKNLADVTAGDMKEHIGILDGIYDKAKEMERLNQLLMRQYANDPKYARIHKRLTEKDPLTEKESKLLAALQSMKSAIDSHVLQNSHMMNNESYVEKMMMKLVVEVMHKNHQLNLSPDSIRRVNHLLVQEYMNEYYNRAS
ncbi:MAG: DEAD/DEAH box helicase family protein [Bacteroidota bacterium]